jgi:hypothetical protein
MDHDAVSASFWSTLHAALHVLEDAGKFSVIGAVVSRTARYKAGE